MLIVRATQKLLHRIGPPTLRDDEQSTTLLGDWYATALFWKPQVALLVNQTTLLPVLMPLAPAATLTTRIAQQIATVLTAHGTPPAIIDDELQHMRSCRTARTANRGTVGIMTEFTRLAETYRDGNPDLLDLTLRLATTPCGPLYSRNISPDRELHALLGGWSDRPVRLRSAHFGDHAVEEDDGRYEAQAGPARHLQPRWRDRPGPPSHHR